ncbi:MBL fold metallo-hydrolase [Roseiflexus sp.]|uniref:MBL fold metallo-hydrolase n=1 Tax=Roseiflexus sp. TaxID=2562120 RepID=UPI0021DD0CE0|nr:MBL fold metallo-hydrolase [Roseiflexus sp.]GIW02803.1 MAG: MBL fold metallo-hydrolase [Roseiflexus sp.]
MEGIHQVHLPLPFPLRIVNTYLIRDGEGWTVIDTGLNYAPGQAAWHEAFARHGVDPRMIKRIVLTHAHPDHYGMAGWLQALSGASVALSAGEAAFARAQWHADSHAHDATATFFGAHGMPPDLMTTVADDITHLRMMTHPVPSVVTYLPVGEPLLIGERLFIPIATPGHSDDHLVFYCAEERLLICGDAVLIKITPNVGLWGWSRGNPLAQFLASLDRLAELDVALALPGHGPLITRFHERLDELRVHHVERLEAMEHAIGAGATAYEVCTAVFPLQELTSHQMRFAMAETLAHLEYLATQGRVEQIEHADGTRSWRRCAL